MGRRLFLLAVLAAAQLRAAEHASRTLTTGWYPWEPYNSLEIAQGNRHLTGLDVELTRAALENAGFGLNVVESEWTRQLHDVEQGRQDLAMGVLETESSDPHVLYSQPYRREALALFVLDGHARALRARNRDDLFGLMRRTQFRLGVANDYSYGAEIDPWLPQLRVVRMPSEYDLVHMLDAGTIDGFIADRLVGATIAWKSGLASRFEIHPLILARHDVRVMFSGTRVSRAEVDAFDRGMQHVRRSGAYSRIVRHYALPLLLAETIDRRWFVVIDLFATVAFAVSGVVLARRERFNVIGAFVLGALPAMGGGTLRDLLVARHPIGILRHPESFLLVGITVAIGYVIGRVAPSMERYQWIVKTFDALGSAALIVVSVLVALQMRCEPLFLWGPILAFVTTFGGGIMRDMVRGDTSIAALKTNPGGEIVILWALLLSLFFYIEASRLEPPEILAAVLLCISGAFVMRMAGNFRGWRAHPF